MVEFDELYKVYETFGTHRQLSFEGKIKGSPKFRRANSSSVDVGVYLV